MSKDRHHTPPLTAAVGSLAPPSIPDHELLRRIGGGSYGEVWLARSVMGTYRAVKIVHRHNFDHNRPFEREFSGIQKFEPISRSHEGLVDLLQVGRNEQESYFYYVMELADDSHSPVAAEDHVSQSERQNSGTKMVAGLGSQTRLTTESQIRNPKSDSSQSLLTSAATYEPKTLRSLLRLNPQPSTLPSSVAALRRVDSPQPNTRLPLDECIHLGLSLTEALKYLHDQGLVHRDIKPSNIIFVGGVPKLADVGLVTGVDEARSYVGTEGFIPPEGPGTPQADIYSLGILLYQMSTGKSHQDFPEPLPDLAAQPDHARWLEFNAVIHKACRAEVTERYQNAEEMRADLQLLQRGQSVKQRHKVQEHIRALRKIGIATAAMVLTAAGIAYLWQATHRATILLADDEYGPASTRVREAIGPYRRGLQGLRLGTTEGFHRAVENFTAAIIADPQFLAAHARLFETYLMSEDYDVHNIASKSEQLNILATNLMKLSPTNAETHAALGIVHFLNEWKWDEAEKEFKAALKANKDCRMALVYYGYMLTRQRRADYAHEVLKRASDKHPGSPLITKFLGHCEYVQRHYDKALKFYREASDLDHSYPSCYYWAMRVDFALGNYGQALDDLEYHEKRQELRLGPEVYEAFRQALEKDPLRARGYWLKCLERIKNIKATPYWYAECHARLGNKTEALKGLKIAVEQRDTVTDLLVDEFWDDYRGDQDFKALLHLVGGLDRRAR